MVKLKRFIPKSEKQKEMENKWKASFQNSIDKHNSSVKKQNDDRYETYQEALMEFISQEQRKHVESQSYMLLCHMLKEFLEKEFSRENQMSLMHAKDNFENYCKLKDNHDRDN